MYVQMYMMYVILWEAETGTYPQNLIYITCTNEPMKTKSIIPYLNEINLISYSINGSGLGRRMRGPSRRGSSGNTSRSSTGQFQRFQLSGPTGGSTGHTSSSSREREETSFPEFKF